MIILKLKERGGANACRVKINAKGSLCVTNEAAAAIAAICTAAQKSCTEITPGMLMELAGKLIDDGKVEEAGRGA